MNDNNHRYRRSGRSTRLIDASIQRLFEEGEVTVSDHYFSVKSDRDLLHRVLKRLKLEHSHMISKIGIDKSRNRIWIKDFNK